MLKLGNKSISNLFIGQKAAAKAFLGQKLVWQKATGLPYDAEVEYLESTGTQWIDTGVEGSSLLSIDLTASGNRLNQAWLGCGTSSSSGDRLLICTNPNNSPATVTCRMDGTIVHPNVKCESATVIEADIANQTLTANGVATPVSFSGGISDRPVYLFAANYGGLSLVSNGHKIYSVKLYGINGVLVRDFIPVRVGGVGYMYDRVSRRLFGNQGSGNFIVGPDKIPIETDQYVQDGLIAMWDGKENAGVGLHDANATIWKDLTGNHVLSYEFTPSFTDNAFELPGTDKVAYCESNLWRDAVNANQCTVEICFKGYSVGGNNSVIALSRGTTSNVERAWWQWGSVAFGYRISTGSTWSNDTLLPRGETGDVSLSFPLADMYMNGTKAMTGSPGTLNIQSNTLVIGRIGSFKSTINGFVTMRADIHSIRIYNKVLTDAEIAANYEIDKRRFNLA